MLGEFSFNNVRISDEHLDYGFGETFHVPLPNFRIGTLQFGHDVETLSQLCKDVHYRVREEGVLAAFLKLQGGFLKMLFFT